MLQLDKLQKPGGPCQVGFQHTSLINSADGRELPIMAWYPAASVDGCEIKHYQPEQAFQLNYDLHFGMIKSLPWPLSAIFAGIFSKIKFVDILTNAYINAPLVDSPARLPVLIFSEGYTSLMTQNTILVEELASRGYVVLSVGIPDETVTEYPDGRITPVHPKIVAGLMNKDNLLIKKLINNLKQRKKLTPEAFANFNRLFYMPEKNEVKASMNAYNDFVHGRMRAWYADLLFVISQLEGIKGFENRLETGRIGVFGMSMGGGVASNAAYYKAPGVVAALSLDGCHYGMPYDAKLEIPFMNIHGYDTSSLLFDKMDHDAYYVRVADTEHLDYTDFTLLEPVYKKIGYTGKKVDPARMLAIMNTYALAFFDKYVRGLDTDSLLKGRPAFDNIDYEYK